MKPDERAGEAPAPSPPSSRRSRGRGAWPRVALLVAVVVAAGIVGLVARPRPDADALWQQAQDALRSDRIDQADRLAGRIARLRDPIDRDLMLRAQVAIARGQSDEALEILAKIPDSSGLAPRARLLAGQLELRRDRLRVAESYFHRALELDPGMVQARRELIYIHGYRSESDAIEEQFRRLAERGPVTSGETFLWSLIRGVQWSPEEIVEVLSPAVERDPEDRRSRVALADALMDLSRFDEAGAVLAPLEPDDPDARAALARLAMEQGDVATLRSLLADAPEDHARLALLRGKLALQLRDPEAAISAYRTALELRPNDRDALSGLSQALNQAGRREEAAGVVERLNQVNALNQLLNEQAKIDARRGPEQLVALGEACAAVGFREQARAWYQAAIALDPFHREAQQALARLEDGESDAGKVDVPPAP